MHHARGRDRVTSSLRSLFFLVAFASQRLDVALVGPRRWRRFYLSCNNNIISRRGRSAGTASGTKVFRLECATIRFNEPKMMQTGLFIGTIPAFALEQQFVFRCARGRYGFSSSLYQRSLTMFSLLCVSILLLACDAANPRCKDENNQVVDWYVLYKLPKVPESSNPIIRSGLAYLHMTSKTVDKGWQLSPKKISAKNSIPGNTLKLLYNDVEASKAFWILYNDDPPNRPSSGKYGHAKGAILASKKQGVWLIHSVPNYPPVPNSGNDTRRRNVEENSISDSQSEYDYPTSGMNYGQSFLCISVDSDQFDSIGQQLMYNQIVVYRRNIPATFAATFPVLTDAANQKRIRQEPFNSKTLLKSSGGVEFISFAKSDKWQKDLYDEFVAPTLKSDLFAETWLNGRGRLPTDCTKTKVYNVISINLAIDDIDVDFTSSRDHSKWAVAVDGTANRTWTCIGDINRADTQYIRGGGTVCLNNLKVWEKYRKAVNDVEPCPKKTKKTSSD